MRNQKNRLEEIRTRNHLMASALDALINAIASQPIDTDAVARVLALTKVCREVSS